MNRSLHSPLLTETMDAPACATGLARTLAVAHALVQGGRAVDLQGIEHRVGALCAKTLDLGPAQARTMLPALRNLRARFDELAAVIQANGPRGN